MEKYNGIERYIFSDVYKFFLKWHEMPNTNDAWNSCIDDGDALVKKYAKHPLVRQLMQATMDQITSKVTGRPLEGLSYSQWDLRAMQSFNDSNQ